MIGVEAFLLCLFGGLLVATGIQRSGAKPIGRALPVVAALGAAGFTAIYFVQVSERVDSVSAAGEAAFASIGMGM